MYPAYEYILLYNVKQKGEERKGKSHMPFKAINIFILMHKHNKPKWYVGGGGYVSLIMDHLFNWNELWTCRNLFKNCVIERKLIENNFIYVETWKKKTPLFTFEKNEYFPFEKDQDFLGKTYFKEECYKLLGKGFWKRFSSWLSMKRPFF